jgi:hypothetical protein
MVEKHRGVIGMGRDESGGRFVGSAMTASNKHDMRTASANKDSNSQL